MFNPLYFVCDRFDPTVELDVLMTSWKNFVCRPHRKRFHYPSVSCTAYRFPIWIFVSLHAQIIQFRTHSHVGQIVSGFRMSCSTNCPCFNRSVTCKLIEHFFPIFCSFLSRYQTIPAQLARTNTEFGHCLFSARFITLRCFVSFLFI